MIDRRTRLRFRRGVRKSKRQVEDIGIQAEEQLERHFIRRLHRLIAVRRFVAGWTVLVTLLMGITVIQLRALGSYYLLTVPAAGGSYTEGIIGSFTNANPLYATGGVDGAVSRLVFASLLKYDEKGELKGDLAESWSVDESGKVFTVRLRNDVVWHDGSPLTVDDVVFTYRTIQNPDAKSPLFASWRDVKVAAKDDQHITFTLPNVLASFPYSLTNGIVPEEHLKDVAPSQLRSDRFNTVNPIGAGPFKWETVEVSGQTPEERQEQIALSQNSTYHFGAPKLQRFVIKTFRTEDAMLNAFKDRQLNAMSGLTSMDDTVDDEIATKEYGVPITGAVMVFFKTSEGVLADKSVRQALVQAADTEKIVNELPFAVPRVDSPLLKGQLGYDEAHVQLSHNVKAAKQRLDEAGWKLNEEGVRQKGEQKLSFNLKAPNSSEFTQVTQQLREMWGEIGVRVDVDQPGDNELQSIVTLHQYEALLYSVSIGMDPDVFAFWHSSQADVRADSRLNFSEYQSDTVDQALEGGRTRTEPALREVKYKPFLQAWSEDAPALALYQPRFLYVVRGRLYGMDNSLVNSAIDRYTNVHNWMIRTEKAYKQ